MDLGENVFMSMINEAVGMPCETEVAGTAGATVDPVCEGATLENVSSQTPCQWLEWLGAAVGTSRSSSGSEQYYLMVKGSGC